YLGPVGAIGKGAVDNHNRRLWSSSLAANGKEGRCHGKCEGKSLGFEHAEISFVGWGAVSAILDCAGIGRLSEAGSKQADKWRAKWRRATASGWRRLSWRCPWWGT